MRNDTHSWPVRSTAAVRTVGTTNGQLGAVDRAPRPFLRHALDHRIELAPLHEALEQQRAVRVVAAELRRAGEEHEVVAAVGQRQRNAGVHRQMQLPIALVAGRAQRARRCAPACRTALYSVMSDPVSGWLSAMRCPRNASVLTPPMRQPADADARLGAAGQREAGHASCRRNRRSAAARAGSARRRRRSVPSGARSKARRLEDAPALAADLDHLAARRASPDRCCRPHARGDRTRSRRRTRSAEIRAARGRCCRCRAAGR